MNSINTFGVALTISPLAVSIPCSSHCNTGLVPAADRNTHFQSSASLLLEFGCRRNDSSDENIDSISMRTIVVRFGLIRICCCSVGRKPASVTRIVYMPGESLSPRKIPCVFVR